MKILDTEHSIPAMNIGWVSDRTVRLWEDSLMAKHLDWSMPVTFHKEGLSSVLAVDVVISSIQHYFHKRYGAKVWNAPQGLGDGLAAFLGASEFPYYQWAARVKADHCLGTVECIEIERANESHQPVLDPIPDAYEPDKIDPGMSHITLLGSPFQLGLCGKLYMSLQISPYDLKWWDRVSQDLHKADPKTEVKPMTKGDVTYEATRPGEVDSSLGGV